MATVATIKAQVLRRLQDTDQNNYGDSELWDYFNLVLGMISRDLADYRARISRTSGTVPIASGTNSGTLPTGFLSEQHVLINGEDEPLARVSDDQIIDYEDDTSTGKPARYWFNGGSIYVNPIADAAYTLKIEYYPTESISADTDSVPWQGLFDDAVYWGVLAECYMRSELFPLMQAAEARRKDAASLALGKVIQRDDYGIDISQGYGDFAYPSGMYRQLSPYAR